MREVRFHNSLSGKKETFTPSDPNKVTVYSCGPTVYNFAHIGNLRAFLFVDLLRRSLKALGYRVDMTMNITDIDDKIIRDSIAQKLTIQEFTAPWIKAFQEDIHTLNIEPLEHYPRATESIESMVEMIRRLQDNGFVYEKDGSLYYSISKFKGYGKLSKIDITGMKSGTRYDTDEYEKDDVRDFVLWKYPKQEGEHSWDTSLGKGRPGWHLECSAMIRDVYHSGVDIHTGGVDLLFPHHENEVAQSEGAYPGESFVKYWLHSEHLLVDGEKMSKSKGNFFTLRDLLEKVKPSEIVSHAKSIRYLLISSHYRTKLNFSISRLEEAKTSVARFQNCIDRLLEELEKFQVKAPIQSIDLGGEFQNWWEECLDSLADDLNISKFLANSFDAIKRINSALDSGEWKKENLQQSLEFLRRIDSILGVLHFQKEEISADEHIDDLVLQRQEARKNKDFAKADQIRDQLQSMGIVLEDTKDGLRWRRK
ncbi:cysteine--tRNA ligase [Leptospira perolatii]|uniref:Cysteine--tRNA ligase n=1 Tax=Leptospira perolatii TaxID=2023191 RepID=A0A2M9ZQU5_9LEPT|nr:cysteine--tRNA ligase [Leptospira perolatii]PJZ70569.1 cysteine--tRNA ligase [Leptospira perolatii]PJZ74405.1 cysteine--tRNA ligase [Leptospira perolatii]